MITLKQWLERLFTAAHDQVMPDGTVVKGNRALRNYLKHHTCTGVVNGVPRWIRLPTYWGRSKYVPKASVPGGVRRRLNSQ